MDLREIEVTTGSILLCTDKFPGRPARAAYLARVRLLRRVKRTTF